MASSLQGTESSVRCASVAYFVPELMLRTVIRQAFLVQFLRIFNTILDRAP